MKPAEEILRETASGIYAIPGDYPESLKELREAILDAMQIYSDQQNKELSVCACKVSDTPCGPNCTCKNPVMSGGCLNCATYGNEEQRKNMAEDIQQRLAEIQRLTKEVEQLKESKEKRISELTAVGMGKQQEIDDTKQSIKNLQCRIQELERFSGWKDMEPHHPIGSNLGYGEIGKEPDWEKLSEIEPPTDNHLDNKAWRGAWLEGQMVGYAKGQIELTRLRELVTQYLDNSTSDNAYGADVRDRIFNELNPKP